ncbi:putative GNAT family acetyltransferase [Bacillus pakistanensis]|uniref:GNAT family acetyltransferase n=1 Tax=Rossellomorea pakistanensis TaxID=992288 RepID=A0ABS2N7K7_9BACI|nr:GNAT family N-acetyltransferase [Bacillus pakistanensis]MBM7583809.1 putative GNAT family acetyltransferase [Bacillus pakistanensis]
MIRKLTRDDNEKCQNLIQIKPAENLFIIGDIEAYGYEQDFQTLWGDFDNQGNLNAVLLKYEENFIPFSLTEFDAKGFADIINHSECRYLSGLKDITAKIEPYLSKKITQKRELYYAKCTNDEKLQGIDTSLVKQANIEDLPDLVNLLKSIPEFESAILDIKTKKRSMEKGVSRSYYIQKNRKMVSSASTTAENSLSAMIVGVCTDQDNKKKGYASQCMTKLCKDVLDEGKELCLFYDNPDSGKIYKRLGFKDIGFWMMYTLE